MTVDGELYDVHDNPIKNETMLMTCYFNIGVDAEIGASKYFPIIVLTKIFLQILSGPGLNIGVVTKFFMLSMVS